jgi:GT2 family glycosyltransferase
VRVIDNATNEGFSRANNRAIAETTSEFVFLLNADAEVSAGALDALLGTLGADPGAAACGPRLIGTDGALQPSAWRTPPTAWETVVAGTGLWRLLPRGLRGSLLLGGHWDHAQRREVPSLFGTALLIRRAALDMCGGFDERFHMYAEDTEWCLRVRRRGWRLLFDPAATVVHHGATFAVQRWGRDGRLRVQTTAGVEFQRRVLSRPRVTLNLATGCAVVQLQHVWRRLRSQPVDDLDVIYDVYMTTLKSLLRGA